MPLFFHTMTQAAVAAAKEAAGVPFGMKVELSFAELVAFLTKAAVAFSLRPTTVKKIRTVKKGWFFPYREEEGYETPAKAIDIPGVGIIPDFEKLSVYFTERLAEGRLLVEPLSIVVWGDMGSGTGLGDEVEKVLLGLFPVYRPELPEPLVNLPVPAWVEDVRTDPYTDVGPGMMSLLLFRSDAERMARQFASRLMAVATGKALVSLHSAYEHPQQPEEWLLEYPADRWGGYSGVVELDFRSGTLRDWELQGKEAPLADWLAMYPHWAEPMTALRKFLLQ